MQSLKIRIKIIITVFFILAIILNSPVITLKAFAHILKPDGSIGAIMHIDPGDEPIAGQESGFFFEFKDREGKFNPEECDCTFVIEQEGEEIFSQPLFQNNSSPSLTNASVFYTFPKKDIYKVRVSGNPKSTGAFQSFNLEYDIRVERESEQSQTNNNPAEKNWFLKNSIFVIGGLGILLILVFAFVKKKH